MGEALTQLPSGWSGWYAFRDSFTIHPSCLRSEVIVVSSDGLDFQEEIILPLL